MAVTGVGSGAIDVGSIVSQLMSIERQPLAKMKQDLSGLQTKLSAWGKMQAAVSTLRDATKVLTQSSTWQASKAGSSDEASVMAVGGGTAAAGTYSLSVQSLAQRHSLASLTRFPAGDTAVITSGGSLEIQLGSVNAESLAFEPDLKRKATPVVIPAGATLAEIRSAINSANSGVSASILDDGDGKRLVLTSKETGKAQAFEITSGDAGLAEFAMSTDPLIGMARKQVAADSKLTINGLEITGKSNQLDGVIEGVTLTLKKVTTTPAEISVGGDQDATKANLEKFVTAYNDLNKLLADQTRYDPGSKTAGALQGNAVAVRIQQQIREQMRGTSNGGASSNLSGAGFKFERDGSMSMDSTKMAPMLASPAGLQKLFAGTAAAPGIPPTGIARLLEARLGSFLDAGGAIASATESLRTREGRIGDQQARFESRLGDIEKRFTRQYSALDVNLSRITSSFSAIQGLVDRS